MGCMHSWLWAERYPDVHGRGGRPRLHSDADRGRNRMWRRMMIDDIRADPDWQAAIIGASPGACGAALQLLFTAGSAPLVQQRLDPAETRPMRTSLAGSTPASPRPTRTT